MFKTQNNQLTTLNEQLEMIELDGQELMNVVGGADIVNDEGALKTVEEASKTVNKVVGETTTTLRGVIVGGSNDARFQLGEVANT